MSDAQSEIAADIATQNSIGSDGQQLTIEQREEAAVEALTYKIAAIGNTLFALGRFKSACYCLDAINAIDARDA